MCVRVALLYRRAENRSSYEPALSESHSSPLCLVLVLGFKLAWGLLYVEGRMAKMEYGGARRPPGASPAARPGPS